MPNFFDKYDQSNPFDKFDEPAKSSVRDAPNAVATGYNKGLLRLAGLPVDTIANVIDLGKAALGAPYTALTGKAAPDMLQVKDRASVFGSGDYLIDRAREKAPAMVSASNPEYEGGYLQAAGGGLNAVINPTTRAQLINQGALGIASALTGKGAYDLTGNDSLAITAGMLPGGAQQAITAGTKYAVRGGEAGRREMAQRIQDLKNAGIDNPTLGLASGNKLIGGAENLLQSTPGAVGIMQRNRDAALAGIEAKTAAAAETASTNRGALESGRSIQSGAKTFQADAKARQEALYNNLSQHIPDQAPVNVDRTRATLSALNADIPTMPELSKQFKNSRIQSIEGALDKDMAGNKTGSPVVVSSILDASGKPIILAPQGAPTPPRSEIPFEAVKKTRTLVGNEIADNSMMSDVPRSKWKPLYGSLSQDMQGAATAAGPDATRTFNRANDFTRASIGRMERVAPIVDRPAPEQSFTALNATLRENASTFQAVKKSLPQGARGDFAGTVIERLGKAKPGQQNDVGDKWSPETFLTNWNNIKPQAREELLNGFKNSAQVKADIDAVARATAMMRDNSKMWANPSGTGANTFARGTLGAIGGGSAAALFGLANPILPLTALGTVGAANLAGRAFTSKGILDSMIRPGVRSMQLMQAPFTGLLGSGLLNQPQTHGLLGE